MRILKQYIPVIDEPFELALPEGSEITCFHEQKDGLYIWFTEPHPKAHLVKRHFQVIGTGQECLGNIKQIWTAMQPPFVWHLVELEDLTRLVIQQLG